MADTEFQGRRRDALTPPEFLAPDVVITVARAGGISEWADNQGRKGYACAGSRPEWWLLVWKDGSYEGRKLGHYTLADGVFTLAQTFPPPR